MTNDTATQWTRDETDGGFVAGGQVGGDVQVTESFEVRFTQQEQPPGLVQYALVTYTFYGASDDVNDAGPPYHVQRQTELMVCANLKDPGGTEIWSDVTYDELDLGKFHLVEAAEAAAKHAATEQLECEEDWSGQTPWDEEAEPTRDEEDATLTPSGRLGTMTSVGFGSKFLGEFTTDHEARCALALEMDRQQFWPNVWFVDDHGGETLVTLDKAVPVNQSDKLGELLPSGTNVTVTYKHYEESGGRPTHETVSGFVDWDYVAIADGLEAEERDTTIAIIADNGRGGPRYLIGIDELLAVTIDRVDEQ